MGPGEAAFAVVAPQPRYIPILSTTSGRYISAARALGSPKSWAKSSCGTGLHNKPATKGINTLHGETMPSDKKNGHNGLAEKVRNYKPTDKEPFMNERQREYFRIKLLAWKEEIIREAKETLQHLQDENQNHPDLADRASSETDRAIELRARDRQRKLIAKIEAALSRLEDGTYGYCEETGDPIAIRRLEARPIATLSIEAQERHERRERVYRDD